MARKRKPAKSKVKRPVKDRYIYDIDEKKSPYKDGGNKKPSGGRHKAKGDDRDRRIRMYAIAVRTGGHIDFKESPTEEGIVFCHRCEATIDFAVDGPKYDLQLIRTKYSDGQWTCSSCTIEEEKTNRATRAMAGATQALPWLKRFPGDPGEESMEDGAGGVPEQDGGDPGSGTNGGAEVGADAGGLRRGEVRRGERPQGLQASGADPVPPFRQLHFVFD